MYECSQCGRLWIEDHSRQQLICFVPESRQQHFLSSIHGEKWKRHLRGVWEDEPILATQPHGYLDWRHIDDSDFREYNEWLQLESDYHAELKQLRGNDTLRNAFLKKNGDIIHEWGRG